MLISHVAPKSFTTDMLRSTDCITTLSVCFNTPILKLFPKIFFHGLIDTNIEWLKAVCIVGWYDNKVNVVTVKQ